MKASLQFDFADRGLHISLVFFPCLPQYQHREVLERAAACIVELKLPEQIPLTYAEYYGSRSIGIDGPCKVIQEALAAYFGKACEHVRLHIDPRGRLLPDSVKPLDQLVLTTNAGSLRWKDLVET